VKVNEAVLDELGEVVINQVMEIFENLIEKDEFKEAFEFEEEFMEAGMSRFIEFCKQDKDAALAGLSVASLLTTDVFFELIKMDSSVLTGEKQAEE
jgi:hypothetical protein